MALDMRQQRATFGPHSGGPQAMNLVFNFPTNLVRFAAVINGFEIGFTNADHHLLRTAIDTQVVSASGATMVVSVTLSLRDNSGNFDDPFSGFVDVLAIVDRV